MSDSNRDPSPNSNTNQRIFRELSAEEQYVHHETNLRALGGREDMPEFGGLSPVHENVGYRDGDIEHEPPLPEDYNPSPTTTTTLNIKQVHFPPADRTPLPATGPTTVYDIRDTITLPITTSRIDIPATGASTIQLTTHIAQPTTINSTVPPERLDQQNFGSASSVSFANNLIEE